MKEHRKLLLALTLALTTGFIGANLLSAEEAKEEAAAPVPEAQSADVKRLDYLGDTKVISVEPMKELFSHRSHVVEYKIACAECHTGIFEQKWGAARAKGNYTHADSFDKGQYCGVCHNGKEAFATVGEQNCVRCHGNNMVAPERIYFQKPVRTVVFEHKGHVDMGLKCADCHPGLFETRIGAAEERPEKFVMQALYDGKFCGACHNGEAAFASDTRCTTCHIGVRGDEQRLTQNAGDKNKQGK